MNIVMVWFVLTALIFLLIVLYLWNKRQEGFKEIETERLLNTEKVETEVNHKIPRIGLVTMMKHPDNVDEWLQHHRDMGIRVFYIRLEESPEVEDYLRHQEDVVLTVGASAGKNEYKEIQVRQKEMVDGALKTSFATGDLDWIIHMDADELLHGSLEEIAEYDDKVRAFWMDNEEAVYDDIPEEGSTCFQASRFRHCQKSLQGDMGCASYANGKAGGRVAPDVRFGGPHRFFTSLDGEEGSTKKLSGLKIRHYESCRFDSYKAKFLNLVQSDTAMDIPFTYYNESIEAAKTGDEDALQCVYTKYRTEQGGPEQECI